MKFQKIHTPIFYCKHLGIRNHFDQSSLDKFSAYILYAIHAIFLKAKSQLRSLLSITIRQVRPSEEPICLMQIPTSNIGALSEYLRAGSSLAY